MYLPLQVPDWERFSYKKGTFQSCMKAVGELMDQALVENPKTLRIFSPDELVSNKLDAVFNHTGRNFQWYDETRAKGGRVIEMLSEHTLQGFLQGYTLTGRVGLFPSYESFLGIVHTMMVQYGKFAKVVSNSNIALDFLTVCRHERLLGAKPSVASIILRRAHGLARYVETKYDVDLSDPPRNTMASLIKIHRSLGPCSISNQKLPASTSHQMPILSFQPQLTASAQRTTST